jgi:origin recognition complex subunit 1
MPALVSPEKTTPSRRRNPKPLPGITREDSDDELGTEDLPWEYIYQSDIAEAAQPEDATTPSRKRKRAAGANKIVGARTGDFECHVGDAVLLKAEGSNEAWVGLICEFGDDEGEMSAHFMWFSSEKEIRNKQKKRTDFLPVSCFLLTVSTITQS